MSAAGCQLYLLTPPRIDRAAFPERLARVLDAGQGAVGAVQLRLKDVSDDEILRACEVVMPICAQRDVAFILNDRADLAARVGADGVHLGQEDGTVAAARALVGPEAVIGVSCLDSRHLAMEAGEQGADYVAFGAFYPTTTKQAKGQPTPDILEWWSTYMELPCVAIGGITADNAAPLVQAGADFLAVVGAVWNHPDGPEAGMREMRKAVAG